MPWEIRAENATVTFGSNYYTATDNETFPIGVYLNGDSKIGSYEVKISYDNRRLEYTGGGDSEENGGKSGFHGKGVFCKTWKKCGRVER